MNSLLVYAFQNGSRFDKVKIVGKQIKFLYFFCKFLCGPTILAFVLLLDISTLEFLSLKSNLLNKMQKTLSQQKIVYQEFIYGAILLNLLFIVTFKKQFCFKLLKLKFTIVLSLDLFAKPISIILCYIIKIQLSSQTLKNNLLIAGTAINLFILLGFSIVFKYFVISNKYNCQNQLQKRKKFSLANLQIIESVGLIIICFLQNHIEVSHLTQFFVFLCMFLLSFFKFSNFQLIVAINTKQRIYINEETNFMNNFVVTLEAITSFIILLGSLFNNQIMKQNIFFLLIVSYIFGIFSIKNYYNYKKEEFKIKKPEQLLNQDETIYYLQTLFDLIKSKKQDRQNQMIFIALKKSHQFQCQKADCFCSRQNQKTENLFEKSFVGEILDKIQLKFSKNKEISLKVQYFRYQYYKNSYKSYNRLKQFKLDKSYMYMQIFIKNLQQNIKNDIKNEQKGQMKNTLSLELPFQVEQTNQKLLDLTKNDIEIRMFKWDYIYQGFCNSIELQKYVSKIMSNMLQIKQIYKKNFERMKQNENFVFLMYFYFNSVSFSKKQTELLFKIISHKLKNTKKNYNSDEKDISQMLNTDKCDVFLIDIKNSESQIVNCTKTVYKNLFYNKKQLLDKKLKMIIPSTYYESHNVLIQNWKNDSNIKHLSTMKQAYVIDKKMNAQSVYLKLKVLIHENKYCMVTALFYLNSTELLLVNHKKQIQYFSKELSNLLLQTKLKSFKIPLELLFFNDNQFEVCFRSNQERVFQVTFINLNKYKHEVVETLNKLENVLVQQAQNARKKIISKFKTFINERTNKFLINSRVKIMKKTMNEIEYFIVKIVSTQNKQVLQLKKEEQKFQKRSENMILEKEKIQSQNFQRDQNQDNQDNQDTSLFLQSQASEGQNIQKSIASSTHNNQNISFHVLMDTIAIKSQNPTQIYDKRLFVFSLQVILISIFGIIILIVSYQINGLGFQQIQDIYFADGAISDNMQLYQFTYNRLMTLKQNINNQTMVNSILESAKIEKDYVYSLFSYDILSLNIQKTPMQGLKYYQYLHHPIVWYGESGIKNHLTILQFFQHLNYITSRIYNNGFPINQKDLNDMLKLFQINFPELKRVNHNQLVIYQKYSISTLDLLYWITFSIVSFHIIFVFYLIIIIQRHNSFRFNQTINCLNIYTHISNFDLFQTKNYYEFLYENISKMINYKLKDMIKASSQKLHLTLRQMSQSYQKKLNQSNETQIHNVHKSYVWMFFLFVFLFVSTSYFLGTYAVISLYQPCQIMMDSVNALMDCQNYLLQEYFDFKAQYLIKNNTIMSQQYFSQFVANINQTVVTFTQIVTEQSIMFQSYDPSFHEAYKKLLIQDVCKLDYGYITDYQYEKCILELSNSTLSKGVVAGMVNFQRTLQKQIYSSLNKSYANQEAIEVFNKIDFREIDESLFYMFKLYQATQAQIYLSLNYDIQNALTINFYFSFLQMILLGFLVIFVLYNYKKQKLQLGKLYTSFLLIPVNVAHKIGSWKRLIIQLLEYDEKN